MKNFAQPIDFDALMEPVALRLLGEPAQKRGNEWRYGTRGSLVIDIKKGTWFDHEANKGGGVFDLIRRRRYEPPAIWLQSEGLLGSPQVVSHTDPKIVKTYDYRDEAGELLFQVVRFEPKDFRQRRPDGHGGWIWKLGDTRRVPYLLPELMKAVAAGETIYIPEGEKDVDNLRAIGLAATTNPGGIKKWRDEYSEHLRGADVVVLPDNHAEGREHGEQVVASLRGIAKRVRTLDIGQHWAECPNKGDISDWIAAGGTGEKLKAIIDALPEVTADKSSSGHLISRRAADMATSEDFTTDDKRSSDQQSANDWLADLSKKSQEARAKRTAEKQLAPAPDEKALVEALARKDHTEYDRVRGDVAETIGIRVSTLDEKVEALRKKLEKADDQDALPHWNVEPWPEPVDGAALLDSIKHVFRRYIVLPKDADIALALWVLHAWTYDAGEISPFLVLVSPTKRCGKTSTLIVLLYLAPRSELSSNITGPALFRYIEHAHPTLLIDEADSFVKYSDELRGILNSGHTKAAAYVRRTIEENGEHKTRRFSTWAPKAIATIRGLADTLEDRAVTITLQRKPPGAKVERLRRRDTEEFKRLRSQAARWAADNFDKLVDPDPAVPEVLNDRAADNWRPLLAIAELVGGDWPDRAREAALVLSGEAQDDAIGVKLLKDIRLAFGDDDAIRSADLVAKLAEDPERPWADWKHGRALTQNQLGRLLSGFGISSETVDIPGLKSAKGYKRARFEEAWVAYCPVKSPSAGKNPISKRRTVEMPVESEQVSDFRSVETSLSDASENGNLSYSHAGFDASTLQNGGNGAKGSSDQQIAPPDDHPHSPESLRRCDHCGQPGTAADPLHGWDWSGRPDGIRLHSRCEEAWHDHHPHDDRGPPLTVDHRDAADDVRCAYCGQPGTPADPLHHGRWRPRKPEGDWVHAGCKSPLQAEGWRRRRNP